jgi:hypothetical protein
MPEGTEDSHCPWLETPHIHLPNKDSITVAHLYNLSCLQCSREVHKCVTVQRISYFEQLPFLQKQANSYLLKLRKVMNSVSKTFQMKNVLILMP